MSLMLHEMLVADNSDKIRTITYQHTRTLNGTIPPQAQAGDLLVFISSCGRATSPPVNSALPAGWTRELGAPVTLSGVVYANGVMYKIATPADLGSTFSIYSTATAGSNLIYVFRKDSGPITSVTQSDFFTQTLINTPNTQTYTLSDNPKPFVWCGALIAPASITQPIQYSITGAPLDFNQTFMGAAAASFNNWAAFAASFSSGATPQDATVNSLTTSGATQSTQICLALNVT